MIIHLKLVSTKNGTDQYGSGGMGAPVGGAYNLWSMLSSGYDMFQGGMGGLHAKGGTRCSVPGRVVLPAH